MPDPSGIEPTPAPQAPLRPDLAGYPDEASLAAGYRASSEEGKRQRERADRAEAMLSQALQSGLPNGRQQVPDRRGTPEDRLTEFGVPTDALKQFVSAELQQALQPLTRGIAARGKVVSDHPDYVQFENDVAQFISQDPGLSQSYPAMFEADPVGAMEYAFLKFGDSRRRTAPTPEGGGRDRMADASIPTSRAGEGRREPAGDGGVSEAYERFQRTGSSRDAAAYAKARLRGVISDQFLNQ